MLTAKEIWLSEEERIKIRKITRDINNLTRELLTELKFQPSNRRYIDLKINKIIEKCELIKKDTQIINKERWYKNWKMWNIEKN